MIADFPLKVLAVACIIGVIFCLALIPYSMGQESGYRTGQIDALNGKIHYRLEKQEDSQFIWVECPDVCDYEKGEE